MKSFQIGIVIILFAAKLDMVAHAQPVSISDPEQIFESGLDSFESGDYSEAYFRFREIYERERVHRKTTAAYLMAGKSLHRLGEYLTAIQLMEEFQAQYPDSRYFAEARDLIAAARQDLQYAGWNDGAIRLGLAFPLSAGELAITRSVFAGIRLAVDAYNRRNEQKIKILFRDTGSTDEGARFAAGSLVEEGVSVIIGPLFSGQVHAAAGVTEASGTVLIAPLATDPTLTEGRRYVFQANATLSERGRSIARQAVEYMNLEAIGIVEEAGSEVSREMAYGFTEELDAYGLMPQFTYKVGSSFDWNRLPQLIGRDTLSSADGIFFSVYHDDQTEASRFVQNGVSGLQAAGLTPYILGPSPWLTLNIDRLGTAMKVYYVGVDYQSTRMRVRRFDQAYKEAHGGSEPDRWVYIGYDIAGLLLENLEGDGDLAGDLKRAPLYEGVRMRIQFGEARRNTALYLFEHTPAGPQLVR